jgi:hypothetical protein
MKRGLSPRVIRGILTALLIAMGMLPAVRADAAVPATMSYQGSLTVPGGQPPSDGSHSFVFRLYNVETGGSALWQESQTLSTSGGLFNALLGAVTPLNLPFDAQYWLESVVDGSLLSPRVKLASAPYAQRALVAESVVGGGGGGSLFLHATPPTMRSGMMLAAILFMSVLLVLSSYFCAGIFSFWPSLTLSSISPLTFLISSTLTSHILPMLTRSSP